MLVGPRERSPVKSTQVGKRGDGAVAKRKILRARSKALRMTIFK
jgi:hypothetical protein